uniref:Uncharacterized protein n=1 Tax=Eutreptiella gymnastica TaxID=73025 RepID=A0A7S1ISC5_9EUGL
MAAETRDQPLRRSLSVGQQGQQPPRSGPKSITPRATPTVTTPLPASAPSTLHHRPDLFPKTKPSPQKSNFPNPSPTRAQANAPSWPPGSPQVTLYGNGHVPQHPSASTYVSPFQPLVPIQRPALYPVGAPPQPPQPLHPHHRHAPYPVGAPPHIGAHSPIIHSPVHMEHW